MGFLTEHPGLLTTVQDGGRYGYESFGMSPSGPMDVRAFRTANILVRNPAGESALEATMMGPALYFETDGFLAITGADMAPLLNGRPCPMDQAVAVRAGDRLALGMARTGCRSYIAFAGGLDIPEVMGSRSTALQNRIGGWYGRRLAAGDRIGFRGGRGELRLPRIAPTLLPAEGERVVRVIMGPQEDCFTREGIETFLSQPYTVSREFDRMGCRLEGAAIAQKSDGNIISDGMVTGAIQVPTSGQPIIMLAERQTVGGYAKIAAVISADLPVVGQCRAGDVLRFQAVSLAEAHRLWRGFVQELEDLRSRLERSAKAAYRVVVEGNVYQIEVERQD